MSVVAAPLPNSDFVALTAQADIHRLFELVVFPALEGLATSTILTEPLAAWPEPIEDGFSAGFPSPPLSPPSTPAALLNEVHEALVQETRRGFALILGATFERQIKTWLAARHPADAATIGEENWRDLTNRILDNVGVDLRAVEGLTAVIYELWEIVSATRHGDGGAARNLAKVASHLWETEAAREGARSADLRVGEDDLRRYFNATLVCWGLIGATPYPYRGPSATGEEQVPG
jgi:hypothetical protein